MGGKNISIKGIQKRFFVVVVSLNLDGRIIANFSSFWRPYCILIFLNLKKYVEK